MVMPLATTSNSGVGKSPGGKSTSAHLPCLRVMPTPCLKAGKEGAVISTPCATAGSELAHRRHGVAGPGVDHGIGA